MVEKIPCPFTYANGKKCSGHITRVEAYKADVSWSRSEDGKWLPSFGQPRSHFHLFCSEKENHAGYGMPDNEQMKRYLNNLPAGLDLTF